MDRFEFDDALITPIIEILNIGTEKLVISILVLASLLAIIDALWGYFQYHVSKDLSSIVAKVIGKLIRYAFIFGILQIYIKTVIPMSYQIFAGIGNSFGEGFGNPLKIQSVWDIGWQQVNQLFSLSGEMDGIWILVYMVFSVIAFLCLVLILSALTMSILSFHIVIRFAVIFLAFVPLESFAEIGKKTLTSIVNSGTELMTCVALSSMCFSVIKNHPFPVSVTADNNSPQVMGIWLCVWLVSCFLVVSHEKISGMIISGHGGITGADFGRYTAGVVATSGAVASAMIAGGTALAGKTMSKIGETWAKQTGSKAALALEKTGRAIEKTGEKTAKVTSKTAQGTAKALETMTGNFSPQSVVADKVRNYKPEEEKTKERNEDETNETTSQDQNNSSTFSEKGESQKTEKSESENPKTENRSTETAKEKSGTENNDFDNNKNKENAGNSSTSGKTAETGKASDTMNKSSDRQSDTSGGKASSDSKSSVSDTSSQSGGNSGNTERETSYEKTESARETQNTSENQSSHENQGSSSTANKTADINSSEEKLYTDVFSGNTDTQQSGYSSYSENHSSNTEYYTYYENTSNDSFSNDERRREKEEKSFADEERRKEKND